jgi:hypothetical protein
MTKIAYSRVLIASVLIVFCPRELKSAGLFWKRRCCDAAMRNLCRCTALEHNMHNIDNIGVVVLQKRAIPTHKQLRDAETVNKPFST